MKKLSSIKHFSFDLWLTLIKSNPTFKKERASYFKKNHNALGKSLDEITALFREVDLMCNSINEITGKNIDAIEMYLMVISKINETCDVLKHIDTDQLMSDMKELFFLYPPQVYCSSTAPALDRIKSSAGTTLNILSNTAFIEGDLLDSLIEDLDLAQYFDFQIYSDVVGVSKPSKEIYSLLVEKVRNIRPSDDILLHEILHVGDNPLADIDGASRFGLETFQINSNNCTIQNLNAYVN